MEIPVHMLDKVNEYSNFSQVMRGIMGIEEVRDPLTNRGPFSYVEDRLEEKFVNNFVNPE